MQHPARTAAPTGAGAPTAGDRLAATTDGVFDVAIVGGGVGGAALFRALAEAGHRTLLVDRGDYASGTSQASGMLVWGGLLYLSNLEVRTVRRLCRARDAWLAEPRSDVVRAPFRYLPLRQGGRARWLVRAALEAYWWLGSGARARPRRSPAPPPQVRAERHDRGFSYEEAALRGSDARLVLDWILAAEDGDRVPRNHVEATEFRREGGHWRVELEDRLSGARATARARVIVNAAGVWADEVSARLGVRTRHRHVFSKGVYLGLARPPGCDEFLALELAAPFDALTLTPWGPIALWGPTETRLASLDGGFEPTVDDLRVLLARANESLARPVDPGDIVSLRVGVRPLAVPAGYSGQHYPLALSRAHVHERDSARAVVTLFGGKLTSARGVARRVAAELARDLPPTGAPAPARRRPPAVDSHRFSGQEAPLLDPARAAREEHCRTLVDYVRRRTNLAQWTPRWGLGEGDRYAPELLTIARAVQGPHAAERGLAELRALAAAQDALLARV